MSQTLTVTGAAALHGVSVKQVRYAIDTGALKAEKLPGPTGPYLLRPKDVEKWLASRPQTPGTSGYFAALAGLRELPALIAQHHSLTDDAGVAEVVTGCKCSPDVFRDEQEWAQHLLDVMASHQKTSGAIAS